MELDLDISHYSSDELVQFLKLNSSFDEEELKKAISQMMIQLLNTSSLITEKKELIITFLQNVKDVLKTHLIDKSSLYQKKRNETLHEKQQNNQIERDIDHNVSSGKIIEPIQYVNHNPLQYTKIPVDSVNGYYDKYNNYYD